MIYKANAPQLRWARISVSATSNPEAKKARAHPHSFYRDGDDKRIAEVEVDGSKGKDKLVARVKGGIRDLLGKCFVTLYAAGTQ